MQQRSGVLLSAATRPSINANVQSLKTPVCPVTSPQVLIAKTVSRRPRLRQRSVASQSTDCCGKLDSESAVHETFIESRIRHPRLNGKGCSRGDLTKEPRSVSMAVDTGRCVSNNLRTAWRFENPCRWTLCAQLHRPGAGRTCRPV